MAETTELEFTVNVVFDAPQEALTADLLTAWVHWMVELIDGVEARGVQTLEFSLPPKVVHTPGGPGEEFLLSPEEFVAAANRYLERRGLSMVAGRPSTGTSTPPDQEITN